MGYIKKKICAASGCTGYALPNSSYCEKHQKVVSRDTTSKFSKFYCTSWWKKARKQFLMSHLWCENCLKQGKYTPATLVHHSKGFIDWNSFCDISNWVAWCDSCHSSYHTTINNEELYKKSNMG